MTDTVDSKAIERLVGDGARWSLLNNVVIRLGTLISGIILARLLTPEDYGVYAVALVVLTVLLSMNEMGVSLAVIRWDDDIRSFAPTVMTLSLASSALLYGACYVAAPSLASLMNAPGATDVLRLLSLLVLIDAIATVPSGILTREFLQAKRFVADLSSFAIEVTVTIILAVGGNGAMSFAVGRVAGGVVGVILVWYFAPVRMLPGWDSVQARSLVKYGLPLAGSSLLVFVLLNVDYIVIGRELDPIQLGLYLMAFNLSSWPVNVFVEAARRVSFAGFSRLASQPDLLGQGFERGIAVLGSATVPVCALLAGYAEPLIGFLYGERWLPAAAALEFLAVLGLMRAVYLIGYDALIAVGRTSAMIALQFLWMILLVPALVIGARYGGIRGASIAHAVVATVVVVPVLMWILSHHGVKATSVARAFARPLLGGAAILLAAVAIRSAFSNTLAQLLVGGLVSAILYLPVLLSARADFLATSPGNNVGPVESPVTPQSPGSDRVQR